MILVLALLSAGCVTREVAQTAGARGWVTDHDSGLPIPGARICLKERQDICTSTDPSGNFELRPIMGKIREFFMVEEFLYYPPGTFSVTAPGYGSKEFDASFTTSMKVELEKN